MVTITLNHHAGSPELMEKLDSSRIRINYMGLNKWMDMIITL